MLWRIEDPGIERPPPFHLVEYEKRDLDSSIRLLEQAGPSEIFELAAQIFVAVSLGQPITAGEIAGRSARNLLEAVRLVNARIRFYQALTSVMFGKVQEVPQTERTLFYPRSLYQLVKLYAHWMTMNYRESYGIFGRRGILFSHESLLSGLEFVTREIGDGIAKGALSCQGGSALN